jgi:hypothetical protein
MKEDFLGSLLFQENRAPLHFHLAITALLDNQLPESWRRENTTLTTKIFFWGYVRDCIYRPPMPQFLPELCHQNTHVAAQVDAAKLQHTQE